jgi:hypothetical protein
MIRRLMALTCVAGTALLAQTRNDSITTSYEIAGVRVIHRRAAANEIIAANLYLLGGTRQVTAATAGIEPLLLTTSERGTASFTREQLRRQLARTGSTIVINALRSASPPRVSIPPTSSLNATWQLPACRSDAIHPTRGRNGWRIRSRLPVTRMPSIPKALSARCRPRLRRACERTTATTL